MRLFIIFTVLTFLVGTGFWISFDGDTGQTFTEVANFSQKKEPVGENSSKNSRIDLSVNNDNGSERRIELLDQLQDSEGQALQNIMDTFWVSCRANNNCQQLLAEYQVKLSLSDYRLLKYYPELNKQWQEVLGELELNQVATLSERIEELKNQASLVWGSDVSRILQDEFALYDFTLESHGLEASNPEQYIDNVENFIGRWEDKAQLLGIDSDGAIFEIGIDLIPEHFDVSDREYISESLASAYLSALQKESLLLRRQQVAAQKQNVKDYNSQLLQLKNDLNQQRSSSASSMSDAQWKVYYETEIRKFRVNFFSH